MKLGPPLPGSVRTRLRRWIESLQAGIRRTWAAGGRWRRLWLCEAPDRQEPEAETAAAAVVQIAGVSMEIRASRVATDGWLAVRSRLMREAAGR